MLESPPAARRPCSRRRLESPGHYALDDARARPTASLALPDPNGFDGLIQIRRRRKDNVVSYTLRGAADARGFGVHDMVEVIAEERAHRTTAQLATHVVDVARSILEACDTGLGDRDPVYGRASGRDAPTTFVVPAKESSRDAATGRDAESRRLPEPGPRTAWRPRPELQRRTSSTRTRIPAVRSRSASTTSWRA